MKNIMKNVIAAGGYRLADMQHKIKKLYAMGDLSDEEADELLTMAQGGVSPDAERPEVLEMLRGLARKVDTLASEVAALKGEPGTEAAGYEPWTIWDGISDRYQPGAIVTHGGKLWISTYSGQNVWEPGTVDERFWAAYTPEEDVG